MDMAARCKHLRALARERLSSLNCRQSARARCEMETDTISILIVDDEEHIRRQLGDFYSDFGWLL
jgi:hypothetical protein